MKYCKLLHNNQMSWVERLGESARSDELTRRQLEGMRYLSDPERFDKIPPVSQLKTDFEKLSNWASLSEMRKLVGRHRLAVSTAINDKRAKSDIWRDIVVEVKKKCPEVPARPDAQEHIPECYCRIM